MLLSLSLGLLLVVLVLVGKRGGAAFLPLIGCALLLTAAFFGLRPSSAQTPDSLPRLEPTNDEVGSGACKSCHPSAFESWHASYHSSMTRTVDQVDFDGRGGPTLPVEFEFEGATFRVERLDEKSLTVHGPDLHALASARKEFARRAPGREREVERTWLEGAARVTRRLVQVTGSHHYLAFWIEGATGRELRLFPFVFLLRERKWAPRDSVFLTPPDVPLDVPAWNSNCIQCHAVSGRPGQTESPAQGAHYDTRVTDRGIACEACHGPGKNHVEAMRSPFVRSALHATNAAPTRDGKSQRTAVHDVDLEIVHPGRLDAARSAALCGQCHAYFLPSEPAEWWTSGMTERPRPEDDYTAGRVLLEATDRSLSEKAHLSRDLSSIFWQDGTIRVGGREYNGLLASPCFEHGQGERKMSCLSCHSMHAGAPNDQLRPDLLDERGSENEMCTQCHQELRDPKNRHSGHAADSLGSACVNCHMPKTTYALLDGLRSHRITSPSHRLSEPPSACALCHVTESEGWLHASLDRLFPRFAAWSAQEAKAEFEVAPSTTEPNATTEMKRVAAFPDVPFGVQRLLAGNAAERALFARALVAPGALALEDRDITAALLTRLLDDPYAAVRRIAERSLVDLSRAPTQPRNHAAPPAFMDPARLDALERRRDDSPLVISE